ncbi:MAG TPA: hypothetical protein VFM46_01445, partial [Pseudomonadales bacterium]|nr:hypothetical protein [Pseudomonadales bacterium]
PCAYQRRFIRWAPRASGGGYKGEYNPIEVETGKLEGVSLIDGTYFMGVPAGQPARDAKGQPLFDHLSDTRNHFCLAKTASGSWQPVLISMASTQIKESKRWMSRIQGLELRDGAGNRFNPPSFSHVYRLKPHKVENSKGSWWAFSAELIEQISDPEAYNKAKEFHKQVATGAVEVQQPVQQEAGSDEEKF